MKDFIRENGILIAGITLPILLALIFLAATKLSHINVDPPAYKMVFATKYNKNCSKCPYNIYVKNGQLRFVYLPLEKNDPHNLRKPELYIYNPETKNSAQVPLPDVHIENRDKTYDMVVYDLQDTKIDTSIESPDGYSFERQYSRNGNLMTEIFGGGYRSQNRHALVKDGVKIRVPHAMSYNTQLIGWIVEE